MCTQASNHLYESGVTDGIKRQLLSLKTPFDRISPVKGRDGRLHPVVLMSLLKGNFIAFMVSYGMCVGLEVYD